MDGFYPTLERKLHGWSSDEYSMSQGGNAKAFITAGLCFAWLNQNSTAGLQRQGFLLASTRKENLNLTSLSQDVCLR